MPKLQEADFDPRNLPPDLLGAIGLAITSFAQTESFLELAIAGCLGIDAEYGAAVTTHMAAPLRFSVLRSAAEIRINDLDVLDELDDHLSRISEAHTKRNEIIHNQWLKDPETGAIYTAKVTSRMRVDAELVPTTIDDVKREALFIYTVGIDFFQFLMRHKLVPPLPPRRPRDHKSKAARKIRRGKL